MPNSLETGWTFGRVVAVIVAGLTLLVTMGTGVGHFLTEYINAEWGAKILFFTALLANFLPRVQWIKELFLGR